MTKSGKESHRLRSDSRRQRSLNESDAAPSRIASSNMMVLVVPAGLEPTAHAAALGHMASGARQNEAGAAFAAPAVLSAAPSLASGAAWV